MHKRRLCKQKEPIILMQKILSRYSCIIYYSVIVVLVTMFATKTSLWKIIPEHLNV